ncbi:MAG: quinol:cytochrome C oxidoreductase [Planctomycetota bacterium]
MAAAAGAVGVLLTAFLAEDGLRRAQFAWLIAALFVLTLGLGALFFVLLQHLVRSGWSVAVRRVAEKVALTIPAAGLLLVPVVLPTLLGHGGLFPWAAADAAHESELIAHKRPWLNGPFFALRIALYIGAWSWLARWFAARSREQDLSGDPQATLAMQRRSAPAMVLYGVTVAFASFDLVMSLTPEWFSTIFGVYVFAGSVLGFLGLCVPLVLLLERRGRLRDVVTVEHYHDLGRLLFAFVFFWGYIAFSQYLLIWYANVPEETVWFQPRQRGGWAPVSLTLVFGHFLLPFAGLLSRRVKRRRGLLAAWGAALVALHYVDLLWLVGPAFRAAGPAFGLPEVAALAGAGGVFAHALLRASEHSPLVPIRDPRLGESLALRQT